MPLGQALLYALLVGILPAFIWLKFFLEEDRKSPEPRWLLLAAFLVGMLAVLFAIPSEILGKCMVMGTWPESPLLHPIRLFTYCANLSDAIQPLFLWAAMEELIKYFLAVTILLWRRAVDEPIDVMIYLTTVAIGFAALETSLFLLEPFGDGNIILGLQTGNLRFIGPTLIHVLGSAIVGFFLAVSFYKNYFTQFVSLCTGLILASVLHALFNHHIIARSGGDSTFVVFFSVWLGIVGLLLLFERAKRITRTNQ